jgi:hypothetical protein
MCRAWRGYGVAGVGGSEFALWLILHQKAASLYWRSDTHTHTLAVHGLEELCFQLCLVLVFWFQREIVFGVTYVLREQYSCEFVSVLWFWWEIVVGVTYVLRVQYSCATVSVFWLWQEIVFGNN